MIFLVTTSKSLGTERGHLRVVAPDPTTPFVDLNDDIANVVKAHRPGELGRCGMYPQFLLVMTKIATYLV